LAFLEPLYFIERGSGSPLLLVHGLMARGAMFEPVIDRFAIRHRVIVPDLRGHGRSRRLPGPYTAVQLASDLSRLLDHLGIDTVAVLGYSHGGAIAQQLVLDRPKRCSRLVLVCTYAYNMASLREKLEGRLVPLLLRILGMRRFAEMVISIGAKELGKERHDWFVDLIADQDRKLMLSAWKEMIAFDSRRRLTEIKCPTLIVAGSNDRAVPFHHARMLHEGIADSRLAVVDGAGHTVLWTHSDELVRITEDFLGD
jgi:pimeloyl-ACP methyl ester carboxylesterase